MGGCRCSYKNCTVRSDGKTHLFHFPVFDKVRCHQWLINAGRYDFLHLKVSQLKNRCICQHHFEDHNFMNDFKDKLKLEAIPTQDGPYCDPIKFLINDKQENNYLYPIAHEDIENDEYIPDRKANYNLKYAEFLTNSDTDPLNGLPKNIWDSEENDTKAAHITSYTHIKRNNNNSEINIKDQEKDMIIDMKPSWDTLTYEKQVQTVPQAHMNSSELGKGTGPLRPLPKKRPLNRVRIISEKKITEPEKKIPMPVSTKSLTKVSPSMVLKVNNNKKNDMISQNTPSMILNANEGQSSLSNMMITDVFTVPNQKNYIISQKTPSMIPDAKEEKISLSNMMITDVFSVPVTLNIEYTNDNQKSTKNILDSEEISSAKVNVNNKEMNKKTHMKPQTIHEHKSLEKTLSYDPSQCDIKKNKVEEAIPSSPKLDKSITSLPNVRKKLSAERVAAINEKRRFNMKLRDIIEEGLNRLDENEAAKRKTEKEKEMNITETVASSLSKEQSLPNQYDYIVSYLEARMEKMENLLLNKIDQNTLKITELKNTLNSTKEDSPVCSESTTRNKQRNSDVEAHKKNIFKEISKFLSPGTSSTVYEELFISKFKPNILKADPETPAKRRRHR